MASISRFSFKQQALAAAIATLLSPTLISNAVAEEAGAKSGKKSMKETMVEEVVVTARKIEESLQDVPISVTALNAGQIDALKVRGVTDLTVSMPNVALDDIGTSPGIANFSIRGLGINSSIPSIDPSVGLFVDGVYMGLNAGVIFDTFDLAGIEVLRGPQGTLFGRNVTGGAVLLKTALPGTELAAKGKVAVEGGGEKLNSYLMGSVSGPVSDNLAAKFSFYTNQDDGYFKNLYDNQPYGERDHIMFRPVVVWDISPDASLIVRYEHSELEGDGAAAQNHTTSIGGVNPYGNFDRDSFDFSIDGKPTTDTSHDFLSAQLDWDVPYGDDGKVAAIFGWRQTDSEVFADIDATPAALFNAATWLDADQISQEIRYSGSFNDKLRLTSGLYLFKQGMKYHERRIFPLAPPMPRIQNGGGLYDVFSTGLFSAADYELTDEIVLNAGLRFSYEKKEARIVTMTVDQDCNIVVDDNCIYDFPNATSPDEASWSNFSPKLGVTYLMSDNTNVYGYWARGFRSGGYNLRNTSIFIDEHPPGPFDEEKVDSYEFGVKHNYPGQGRVSAAVFLNDISDMQRELNVSEVGNLGIVQYVANSADAKIFGIEMDGLYSITDSLVFTGSVGWLDADYVDVFIDLVDLDELHEVNEADRQLSLPRAAKLTYSLGLNHSYPINNWTMDSRISYAFRDKSAYNDNNVGILPKQKMLDAGIDFLSNDGAWTIGVYFKNLLDEVGFGGDTILPPALGGGTFSPLTKGRRFGVEVTYEM